MNGEDGESKQQAEQEARELWEDELLHNDALFSKMAHKFMDDAGYLGSFLDWCWESHKRGLEDSRFDYLGVRDEG